MTLRCLIVDDSPAFLAAARALLERQGIDVVGLASNGSAAVQLAEQLSPDVVLLDIGLDGESGFEVARRLHGEDSAAEAAVLLMSTLSEQDYGDLIAASCAVGFVPKISLSAEVITGLLDRRGPPTGALGR